MSHHHQEEKVVCQKLGWKDSSKASEGLKIKEEKINCDQDTSSTTAESQVYKKFQYFPIIPVSSSNSSSRNKHDDVNDTSVAANSGSGNLSSSSESKNKLLRVLILDEPTPQISLRKTTVEASSSSKEQKTNPTNPMSDGLASIGELLRDLESQGISPEDDESFRAYVDEFFRSEQQLLHETNVENPFMFGDDDDPIAIPQQQQQQQQMQMQMQQIQQQQLIAALGDEYEALYDL